MNPVLIIYLFKALVILVGLAFVYMGYKLFIKGITAPAGSFIGEAGGKKIKLLRFAPGIFFALVGTVVVVVGSTRKFSMKGADGLEMGPTGAQSTPSTVDLEFESTGSPPTQEGGDATDPSDGVDAGEAAATGHTAATSVTICDTCDVR